MVAMKLFKSMDMNVGDRTNMKYATLYMMAMIYIYYVIKIQIH